MSQTKLRVAISLITLFLISVIPTTTFILSQNFRSASSADSGNRVALASKKPSSTPKPTQTPVQELASNAEKLASTSPTPSPSSEPEISFGPTLSLKISLEGRPTGQNATKLFIGLAAGTPQANPNYLLSFTIDVPDSGEYDNLSLAGLTVGNTYTAYVKGEAQIATASAFILQPSKSILNQGQTLQLTTGDLNEDNKIDASDLAIITTAYGSGPTAGNWNRLADFNLDNIINAYDMLILRKNLNQTGNSGSWISTPTQSASTTGGSSSDHIGAPPSSQSQTINGQNGYWMWVPKL